VFEFKLMKEKHSEEYEALEEVFDRSTLMTVYDFLNKGVIDQIFGAVKDAAAMGLPSRPFATPRNEPGPPLNMA
jgi:hypothetical protein